MKNNPLTALVLFVLALALGMPCAFRVGNKIVALMHPLPPAPANNTALDETGVLTDLVCSDAVRMCRLMQSIGVGADPNIAGSTNCYATYEKQILEGRIRTDPKDPSDGIYEGQIKLLAYDWQHRSSPPSRYEE